MRSVNDVGTSAWVPDAPVQAKTVAAELTVSFSAASYSVDEGSSVTITVLVSPAADRDDDVAVTISGDGVTVSGLGRTVRCPLPAAAIVPRSPLRGSKMPTRTMPVSTFP